MIAEKDQIRTPYGSTVFSQCFTVLMSLNSSLNNVYRNVMILFADHETLSAMFAEIIMIFYADHLTILPKMFTIFFENYLSNFQQNFMASMLTMLTTELFEQCSHRISQY